MERRRTFSGVSWESKAGYCRALRVGNHIYVSGTAPITPEGGVFAPGDAYAQTRYCLEIICKALQDLDADCQAENTEPTTASANRLENSRWISYLRNAEHYKSGNRSHLDPRRRKRF